MNVLVPRLARAARHWLLLMPLLPLACLVGAATSHAQPAAPVSGPAADAALAVTRSDIEQRVAPCIACHGRVGASSNAAYYPRLAGKPEGYLFNQLRSFRDGRRHNTDMSWLVRHLSDDYLREMARYFAQLDLPYPPVPSTSDASAEVLAQGRRLVFEGDASRGIPACAACHGAALTGVLPAIPSLVGLPRLYLSSQLGDWITGSRHALPPDCMADVGRRLSPADVNAVASWLAVQPVPAQHRPMASLPGRLPMPCSATEGS